MGTTVSTHTRMRTSTETHYVLQLCSHGGPGECEGEGAGWVRQGGEHEGGRARGCLCSCAGDHREDESRLCACMSGKVGRQGCRWMGGVMCIEDRASSTSMWLCRGTEGRTRMGCVSACVHWVRQGGVVRGSRANRGRQAVHIGRA